MTHAGTIPKTVLLAESDTVADLSPSIAAHGTTIHRGIDRFFRQAAVWVFIFSIAWLSHFSQSRNMGFYSDDITFAVPPLTWTIHDVNRWIHLQMRIYPEPQGRPLGFLLGLIIPYFGNELGGLEGMFVIGWVILSINTLLLYYLLRRCLRPPLPFLGALFFLLFPADTTREFLCHAHILQPSLTFMLVAGHLYLSGTIPGWRLQSPPVATEVAIPTLIGHVIFRVLSYVVIAACLVTYETALLPFLAMPLLERARDRRWRIEFGVHLAIVMAIVVAVYITRMHGGEYRAVEASSSKLKVLGEIIGGSIIGPAAIVKACVYRAFQATRDLFYRPWQLLGFIAAFGVFALTLLINFRRSRTTNADQNADLSADIFRAAQFGLAATVVSYLFCFTHFPPGCIEGQETSVHLAAAVGASTLLAAGAGKLMQMKVHQPWLAGNWFAVSLGLIALYFALIFSAARDEQDSYVLLWRQKQQFWTRLLDLCPDLKEGTMVICDGQLAQPTVDHRAIWFMPPNCWSDSLYLRYSYKMPADWKVFPQVSAFPLDPKLPGQTNQSWKTWLDRDRAGKVVWNQPPYGRRKGDSLIERNTILLHVTPDGRLTRDKGTVEIGGKPFHLNGPVSRGKAPLLTLPLYSILTGTVPTR